MQVFQYDLRCVRVPAGGAPEGQAASHAGMKRDFILGEVSNSHGCIAVDSSVLVGGTMLLSEWVDVFHRTAWLSSSGTVSL